MVGLGVGCESPDRHRPDRVLGRAGSLKVHPWMVTGIGRRPTQASLRRLASGLVVVAASGQAWARAPGGKFRGSGLLVASGRSLATSGVRCLRLGRPPGLCHLPRATGIDRGEGQVGDGLGYTAGQAHAISGHPAEVRPGRTCSCGGGARAGGRVNDRTTSRPPNQRAAGPTHTVANRCRQL